MVLQQDVFLNTQQQRKMKLFNWKLWSLVAVAVFVPVIAFGKKTGSPGSQGDYFYTDKFLNAVWVAVGNLNPVQEDSVKKIVNYYYAAGYNDLAKLCYILATAWHECSLVSKKEIRCQSFQPCYWAQENYWYTGYYGRGFVQLTWESNYQQMSDIIGIDLVTYPDAVLEPEIAAKVIVEGMEQGTFTGLSLSQFINANDVDFYNARKVVNGLDNAGTIAETANDILFALPV